MVEANAFFLDDRESELIDAVLALLTAANPMREAALREDLQRLGDLARLLKNSPPIANTWQFVGRDNIAEAIVDSLGRLPQYDFELQVPTKAALGQGYLVAKISFFKSLDAAIESLHPSKEIRERMQLEIGQSIHSKMAEELFTSLLTDSECERAVRVSAASHLVRIWDDRLLSEIDDFAPLLEAAWQARVKVRPTLGTMLGAAEIYQLFQHTKDERFLDYFGRDDVPVEELNAFEEFMFGISHEEIAQLRKHIAGEQTHVVSRAMARSVLGSGTGSWVLEGTGPQALFASYRRRRIKARYRALMHTEGPKRTAEEYVMIAFLKSSMRS